LGILATINLEVVPFRVHAPFSAFLPFLKCILEVVEYEGVQHHLRYCLGRLNYLKRAVFQFYR
jgi:hypothetical protein